VFLWAGEPRLCKAGCNVADGRREKG
jgi:hypothetical protein